MKLEEIPAVGPLLAAGANDHVFDVLLLLGPITIVTILLLGRTWLTSAIAVAYTAGFLCYIVFKGLTTDGA